MPRLGLLTKASIRARANPAASSLWEARESILGEEAHRGSPVGGEV